MAQSPVFIKLDFEGTGSPEEVKRAAASLPMKVAKDIAHFGGYLQCRRCGSQRQLDGKIAKFLIHGWPACCGETMEWLTEDQLAGRV